jgi:hypothetical protein
VRYGGGVFSGGLTRAPDHGPEHWVGWLDGRLDIGFDARGSFPADPARDRHWRLLGVEYEHVEQDNLKSASALIGDIPDPHPEGNYTASVVDIPYWVVSVVLVTLPLSWLTANIWAANRRRRRLRQGRCMSCGYDLRSTPERCPECGAPSASRSSPR